MENIDKMQSRIEFLESECHRLRGLIGNWRRKAEGKAPREKFFKQGFRQTPYGSEHYLVYVIPLIPGDLPIEEVLEVLKTGFLKDVQPYIFLRCDYTKQGWLVEVYKKLPYNMHPSEINQQEQALTDLFTTK